MSENSGSAVLETRGLCKRFGGIVATDNVMLSLAQGARHALIGPNGAGKTTLVNLLTGVLAPSAGTITLDGQDITRLPSHERARRGLTRTFQINQLFPQFTPLSTIAMLTACLSARQRAMSSSASSASVHTTGVGGAQSCTVGESLAASA